MKKDKGQSGKQKEKRVVRERDGNIYRVSSKLNLSSSVHFGCMVEALVLGQAR